MWDAIPACEFGSIPINLKRYSGADCVDMKAKLDAEIELHSRKSLQFTVVRPGGLTEEPAAGAQAGVLQVGKTRCVPLF